MKYTVSETVERALQMADLKNTDFLSHKEITDYLQDAWREMYQIFINNADKQFIKEVELRDAGRFNGYVEYTMPSDLYSIYSIKETYSGRLLSRHVESSGVNDYSYEVVNNKIRIYGAAPIGKIIMTYYVTPTYLSYPDKDIEDVHINGISLDTVSNSIMYHDGDKLYVMNVKTKEIISDATIAYNSDYTYVLGNGHILVYSDELLVYYDYDGNELFTANLPQPLSGIYKDWNGYVYYNLDDKLYLFGSQQFNQVNADNGCITPNFTVGFDSTKLYINYRRKAFEMEDPVVVELEDDTLTNRAVFALKDLFDNKDALILTRNDGYHMILIDEDCSIEEVDIDIYSPISFGVTNYGIICSSGTDVVVKSLIPDTLLNFPNELYFTLLAANVAIRMISKQNVANEGLNQIYDNSMTLYLNSLGQNADYQRIKDVY